MLFDSVFQLSTLTCRMLPRCDLMLFDSVFQFAALADASASSCDLMLFDSVFQLGLKCSPLSSVVI